jgi:hypothetical protein
MKLYVGPMDSVVVDFENDGKVQLDGEGEFRVPSLQERRAIIYAARSELAALTELLDVLERTVPAS